MSSHRAAFGLHFNFQGLLYTLRAFPPVTTLPKPGLLIKLVVRLHRQIANVTSEKRVARSGLLSTTKLILIAQKEKKPA